MPHTRTRTSGATHHFLPFQPPKHTRKRAHTHAHTHTHTHEPAPQVYGVGLLLSALAAGLCVAGLQGFSQIFAMGGMLGFAVGSVLDNGAVRPGGREGGRAGGRRACVADEREAGSAWQGVNVPLRRAPWKPAAAAHGVAVLRGRRRPACRLRLPLLLPQPTLTPLAAAGVLAVSTAPLAAMGAILGTFLDVMMERMAITGGGAGWGCKY